MNHLTKQQSLLAMALCLACLQFVFKPWLNYLQQQHQALQQTTRHLERVTRLILAGDSMKTLYHESQDVKKQIFQQFPVNTAAQSESQFRLSYQQNMEQLLMAQQADLLLFDWLGSMQDDNMYLHTARLSLRGEAAKLMQAYMTVFFGQPGLNVQQFSLQQSPFQQNQSESTLTLQIQLAVLSAPADIKVE